MKKKQSKEFISKYIQKILKLVIEPCLNKKLIKDIGVDDVMDDYTDMWMSVNIDCYLDNRSCQRSIILRLLDGEANELPQTCSAYEIGNLEGFSQNNINRFYNRLPEALRANHCPRLSKAMIENIAMDTYELYFKYIMEKPIKDGMLIYNGKRGTSHERYFLIQNSVGNLKAFFFWNPKSTRSKMYTACWIAD